MRGLTAVVVMLLLAPAVPGQSPDRIIGPGQVVWEDGNRTLTEPWTIVAGGELVLRDFTVHLQDGARIDVLQGGLLTGRGCAILGQNDTAIGGPVFAQGGRLDLEACRIEGLDAVTAEGPAARGSRFVDNHFEGNARALNLGRTSETLVQGNLFRGNGAGSGASGMVDVNDAAVTITDNVFVGNTGGFGVVALFSTTVGSKLMGPVQAELRGNVFVDNPTVAVHNQNTMEPFVHYENNLFVNNTLAVRMQTDANPTFARNSFVNNTIAVALITDDDTHLNNAGFLPDLSRQYWGGGEANRTGANRVMGPAPTDDPLAEDPNQDLWEHVAAVRSADAADGNTTDSGLGAPDDAEAPLPWLVLPLALLGAARGRRR